MAINPTLNDLNRSLVLGDNLHIMEELIEKGYSGKFDMIYFDGPFNSGLIFSMFNDQGIEFVHPWDEKKTIRNHFYPELYLSDYRKRMELARKLLSDTGMFVLQINQIMSHYVKVVLDEVFNKENYLMEVIWKHSHLPWSQEINQFGYQHESLFFYGKSENHFKKPDMTYPSVWDDVGGYDLGEENTFFPSQKPQSLVERIVEATTKEGDLVGDFYTGSGTLPVVAEKMNRRWFACDNHAYSMQTVEERLGRLDRQISLHTLVEDFNEEYLVNETYHKKSNIPYSLHEHNGLKSFVGDREITINAYSYAADVDLSNTESFTLNIILPSSMNMDDQAEITLPRPEVHLNPEGFSFKHQDPLKWIFYHLVHVERDKFMRIDKDKKTGSYLLNHDSLVEKAEEIYEKLKNNWIHSMEEKEHFIEILDQFGYRYRVNPANQNNREDFSIASNGINY
jgi:DNA modification methylase